MFVYAKQEDSYKEHEHLLAMEQEMLAKVEVPYRIIDTAAGDLGSSAARKFDCEAWVPTQGRYRELTSTSNCTEYQARRLNIRERMEDGGTRPVSTLNGTLATTRWLVAIMENHQQKDGSIEIPQALSLIHIWPRLPRGPSAACKVRLRLSEVARKQKKTWNNVEFAYYDTQIPRRSRSCLVLSNNPATQRV